VNLISRLVVKLLPLVPRSVVGAVAKRYIAGETLDEALDVARDLNRRGFSTTMDLLGEDTGDVEQARNAASDYSRILEAIELKGIDGNVSVKPTQFGLGLDPDLCLGLFRSLSAEAGALGHFVRVEMEDSRSTDATLTMFRALRRDFDNVGIVIQSYLHRSPSDVDQILELKPNVRMVKGVYAEPPAIAYQDRQTIRDRFVSLSETLLSAGAYVAFATHDDWLVEQSLELVRKLGLEPGAYEFQMLLGVRPELGERVLREGHRLRIYVPFGRDWYRYSLRRLRENPKMAGYILDALLRRGLG
jgi:proline dehydrogenase